MAPKNAPSKAQDAGRTMIITFTKDSINYRMMVARVHVHPGERDRIEVEATDMLGGSAWTPVPDGSNKVPSPEWIIRRAMWRVFSDGLKVSNTDLMTVELGEI